MYTLNDILTGTGGTLDPHIAGPANLVLRDVVIDFAHGRAGQPVCGPARRERTTGIEFIADAVGHGARPCWRAPTGSRRRPLGAGVAVIRVADTLQGLQALATWWRGRFPALQGDRHHRQHRQDQHQRVHGGGAGARYQRACAARAT